MNYSKPKAPVTTLPNCPVCGKTTYSRGGIHPQCASERADKIVRAARLESEEKVDQVVTTSHARPQWTKPCPRCKRLVPARRAACDCGFEFLKKAN